MTRGTEKGGMDEMTATLTERLTSTPKGMQIFQQERAIQEITEIVCEIMEEQDVSRSALADRLGKTKGYITQLLDGRANMTVRTISDVFGALNRAVHFQEGPLQAGVGAPQISCSVEPAWEESVGCWTREISWTLAPKGSLGKLAS